MGLECWSGDDELVIAGRVEEVRIELSSTWGLLCIDKFNFGAGEKSKL